MEEQKKEVLQIKKFGFRDILNIIFLILLMVAIGALVSTTITIIKYKNVLINPVGQNLANNGINYCTCYDFENRIIPIKSTNYSTIADIFLTVPEYSKPNISEFNIMFNRPSDK